MSIKPATDVNDEGYIDCAPAEDADQQERTEELMVLGRLLSTRRTTVKLDGRARIVVPREFREFLGVEPSGQVCVVGAAVCIEIWRPSAWVAFVEENIPRFRQLLREYENR